MSGSSIHKAALMLALAGAATVAGAGANRPPAAELAADYERLKEWRFAASPVPLPAGGMEIRRDTAVFRLVSGAVRPQEPTAAGRVTGFVFEGEGTFRMTVPDTFERAQLARFAVEPDLETLDETFSTMVLRTSDPELIAALGTPAGGFKRSKVAAERHDHWLRIHRQDADASVLSTLVNEGETYLRVDIKTDKRGWMTWEYDSRRHEEIHVVRFNPKRSFLEHWLALDREEDRDASGRPGPVEASPIDLEHATVDVRLLRLGKDPGFTDTSRHTLRGEFRAELTFAARRPGIAALRLFLLPYARLESIESDGRPLLWLRDHIGSRSSAIDNRTYDASLIVLLDEPLEPGVATKISFVYELDLSNYAPGRLWYPGIEPRDRGLTDLHTVEVAVTTRDEISVRAMGRRVDESTESGLTTSRWVTDHPVKMATFSLGRKTMEETIELPELPEIVVFSPPIGRATEERLHDIGVDVAQSVSFFGKLLAAPLANKRIYATMIQAFHGQSFDGFLHLSEFSAFRDRSGPTEVFLAHEVAHQWWGNLVGWASYRDQWLSEGLAEYSALLYLEATHEKGEELFVDALAAFTSEILGSIRNAQSPFARTGMSLMNKTAAKRIGPIGHGTRAATGAAPAAYASLSYHKAALVLHMLRVLMRHTSDGEAAFVDILRDFVAAHRGGQATTADFVAAVERHAPGDWDWFFDQWIYRAEVPSWKWKADVAASADGQGRWAVELNVAQSGVPDDFHMLVPVRAELAGGGVSEKLMEVRGPETVATLLFDTRPRKVIFNPDYSILAEMKRK